MFHLKHIEDLLEKYWEGETTLEEERHLKMYFSSGEVDVRLRQFAPLFQVLREEQAVELLRQPKVKPIRPQQYNWQSWAVAASVALFMVAGWWWSRTDHTQEQWVAQTTDTLQHPSENHPVAKIEPQETPQQASLMPRVTFKKKNTPKRISTSRLKAEEEQAMEEIMAALALVSSKMSKGRREAAKGAVHLENVDKIFKKKKDSDG